MQQPIAFTRPSLAGQSKPIARCRLLGISCASLALGLLLVAGARAAAKTTFAHEYRRGNIRIFYNTEGEHAVKPTDANQNGVPDQVEDLATQTTAAYLLFVDTLEFPNPFKSERYRDVPFLDIHLLAKAKLGSNGVAYDELQRFARAQDPANATSLCFNVATSVDPAQNMTPAHEFFHIIQNGATHFKNTWYTEGTARWSEQALGLDGIGRVRYSGPWPLAEKDRIALFAMRYEAAERFWNPLALAVDAQGMIPEDRVAPALRELTYCNGEKVLKGFRLHGWKLMRDLLIELGRVEPTAYRDLGYTAWTEANQRSPQNNAYIYRAAAEIARQHGLAWPEPAATHSEPPER